MRKSRIWSISIPVLTCALLLAAWLPPSALALPPRPTPEPTVPSPKPPNGAIELTVEAAPVGLWTIVQWQDALGGWHDVEGWQGTLDDGVHKTWWVDKADYGKGPFRWVVIYGEATFTSDSFYLPAYGGEVVRVQVSLEP